MGSRGRKSTTELVTPSGAVAVIVRPKAPLDLTPEQADVWATITDTMAADWFSPENFPLLAQYCRHTIEARRVAQLIDQECARPDLEVGAYGDLLKLQRQETAALKTLAASMRLAQQARYGAQTSATSKKNAGTVRRPWE